MVSKSSINILCSSHLHLMKSSNISEITLESCSRWLQSVEWQWNEQVTGTGHLWPAAPTWQGCREQPGEGKAQGRCPMGKALCKCISVCVHLHTDALCKAHEGLTPWCVNNCKTWFVLSGRLHWELKVLSILQVWTQRLLYLKQK